MTKPKARKASNGKGDAAAIEGRLALLHQLTSRTAFASRMAGIQYGGLRDIYSVAGYPKSDQLKFSHFWSMYTRGDVAGRIVDMPAKTTWRTPPQIVEDKQPEGGTEFTKAFDKLAKRLKVWSYFNRADRLAGVGRYAVIFIGVRGASDLALRTPLQRLTKPEDVIFLSVYNEENAEITDWETDPGSERYGFPKMYKLRTVTAGATSMKVNKPELIVHASRCLHVAEDVLEDEVFGRPRLERSYNRLSDLEKVAASTGEAYWQQVTQILQAKADKDVTLTDEQLDQLDEKLSEMVHDLRRQFTGKGIELGWLNTTTPNVDEVADFYFSLIAGASGIPKRILFGSEMGELASTTDQQTYLGMINERQEQFAEPVILRQFIDRLIEWGALKPPGKGDYQIVWPTLFEVPDKEKAEVDRLRAEAAAALTPVGGNPRELVRIDKEGRIELVEREPDDPGNFDAVLDPTFGKPPEAEDEVGKEPPAAGEGAGKEKETDEGKAAKQDEEAAEEE